MVARLGKPKLDDIALCVGQMGLREIFYPAFELGEHISLGVLGQVAERARYVRVFEQLCLS